MRTELIRDLFKASWYKKETAGGFIKNPLLSHNF